MKIGILYNIIEEVSKGVDIEKIADNEVIDTANAIKEALLMYGYSADLIKINNSNLNKFVSNIKRKYDFIFNVAEGLESDTLGESKIAEMLHREGIPFTGSNHDALSTCVDKEKTKKVLLENGIPTPNFQIFNDLSQLKRIETELSFPVIVKPVHEDGSIGINSDSVVNNKRDLKRKVKDVMTKYKQSALVEEYIDGREINAAILGNGEEIEVLPLSEITFNNFPSDVPKILTFEGKWIEDSAEYSNTIGKCPAELDSIVHEQIKDIAKKSFSITGCRDYARVDFRVRDNKVYVIEVNPNPCINPQGAGFIRSANTAGYSYNDLINKILRTALMRHSPFEKMIEKVELAPVMVSK